MSRETPPVDATTFRRTARVRAFGGLVGLRLTVAPVLGTLAVTFMIFEPTLWRRLALSSVVTMLLTLSVVEFVRYRRSGVGVLQVPLNFFAMALGQAVFIFTTGGLFSPLIPVFIVMSLVSALLIERRAQFALAAIQIPTVWAMAVVHQTGQPVDSLMPALFGEAAQLEESAAPWIAATVYTMMLLGTARIGAAARKLFEDVFSDGIRERDRALALHAEQSRALTALSAEIAHALKNPLASVKGLGALVAKDVDGKTRERVGVLRREVDRMQEILEELLNFSRPLVPLSMEDVDLLGLARDVAHLHEGSAAVRKVRIEVCADAAVELRCDPRKVRSILINLVQNALEASPERGTIELRVGTRDASTAEVRVIDEGSGLSSEIEARIFDPGVTSKPQGSGLGLVIARSLARQHGGELTVSRNEETKSGCVAELTLPVESPQTSEAATHEDAEAAE